MNDVKIKRLKKLKESERRGSGQNNNNMYFYMNNTAAVLRSKQGDGAFLAALGCLTFELDLKD